MLAEGGRAVPNSCFVRSLVPPSTCRPIKKDWDVRHSNFTPERYEKCLVLFSRQRFARTCSRCSPPPRCSSTTQNDLATGNKVNSALDNPTNFFTAQGLNNRASDITNLLDSIGNGVQVLQAANTGITSLQSLVDSAKSIANQVLQSPVGYTTKSNVTSTAITGATANNLLGTRRPTLPSPEPRSQRPDTRGCDHGRHQAGLRGDLEHAATTPRTDRRFTVDGKSITFTTAQTTRPPTAAAT